MSTSEGSEVIVVGLGNPLMGDDGIGLCALRQLESEWTFDGSTQLVDGGTWGLNLLPALEGSRSLLFLDAIRSGRAPGSLVELRGDAIPRQLATKLSPHEVDLRELLAVMQLRGTLPANVSAIGVEPDIVEMHDGLSAAVRSRIRDVVSLAVDRLRSWGVSCSPNAPREDACTR